MEECILGEALFETFFIGTAPALKRVEGQVRYARYCYLFLGAKLPFQAYSLEVLLCCVMHKADDVALRVYSNKPGADGGLLCHKHCHC